MHCWLCILKYYSLYQSTNFIVSLSRASLCFPDNHSSHGFRSKYIYTYAWSMAEELKAFTYYAVQPGTHWKARDETKDRTLLLLIFGSCSPLDGRTLTQNPLCGVVLKLILIPYLLPQEDCLCRLCKLRPNFHDLFFLQLRSNFICHRADVVAVGSLGNLGCREMRILLGL